MVACVAPRRGAGLLEPSLTPYMTDVPPYAHLTDWYRLSCGLKSVALLSACNPDPARELASPPDLS